MGMFDFYKPKQELKCPVCNFPLKEWQGKDADCALFVWQEGEQTPIGQKVDDSIRISEAELSKRKLPEVFIIYCYECNCGFPVMANCQCKNGVWVKTELITKLNAVQWKHERKSDFRKRLKWLSGS